MLTYAGCNFTEPAGLWNWKPVPVTGIYAIVVPDAGVRPRPYRPIYFGQTIDFALKGFPGSHALFKQWVKAGKRKDSLYISIHVMPGADENQRRLVEKDMIAKFHPACNPA
jgi:hypothetical protein